MTTRKDWVWGSIRLAGIVLTALASTSLADEAAEEESRKLEGTWKFVSLMSDGQEAPKEVIEKWRWSVRGDEITWGDPIQGETKTSFKIDPSKSPKAIEITALDGKTKGKSLQGIYRFEGERLTVCLPEGRQAEEGRTRPEEFGGGQGMSLFVLERIEDK
jgi:uncharacterized protein (TIGR03067 family)